MRLHLGAPLRLRVLPAVIALVASTGLLPAQESQLDASESLFTVMVAINAAGFDADLNSTNNHPLRAAIRKHLDGKNLASIAELKRFFVAHRQPNPAAELSQYVSFALCVEEPPTFKYRYPSIELPPDVVALTGLESLLPKFYEEANLADLWRQSQPAIEQALARYHEPVTAAVTDANGYLRNPTSGFLGRRFQIYLDLIGPPNQVHTRSYKDDYFVVVTPSAEPNIEDVRHAYLHYLLDPLFLKYAEPLNKKKALLDYAQPAPALEEYYKTDFLLLGTESLIKAIEARLTRKPILVEQALKEGFILAPFFAEQLALYEKQEQAMRLYFPEMANALNLKKEEGRLEKVEFAAERATRLAKVVPAERPVAVTGAFKTLETAEQRYSVKDYDKAKELFLQALRETDDKGAHARSYFGLAKIAALQKNPELAEKLFQKTLELQPDPETKGWAHVFLGRLADLANEREQAAQHYQAALAVDGASAAARKAAQDGLQQSFGNEKKQ